MFQFDLSKDNLERLVNNTAFPCCSIEFNMGNILSPAVDLKGTIIYPELNLTRNPHIDKISLQSIAWARGFNLSYNAMIYDKLETMKVAGVFSTALTHRTNEDFKIFSDYAAFLFLFDDIVDKHWKDIESKLIHLQEIFTVFMDAFSGKYTHVSEIPEIDFPLYKNFCASILDIVKRLKNKKANPKFFLKEMHGYFYGILWELQDRLQKDILTEESYLKMRCLTGAVRPSFELISLICEYDITEQERENPVFERIVTAANSALCIMNDIVSFSKEVIEPQHCNFISIQFDELMNDPNKSHLTKEEILQQAINLSVKRHNAEVYDFIRWRTLLPQDNIPMQNYCIILLACLWDNMEWSFFITDRYLDNAKNQFSFSKTYFNFKASHKQQEYLETLGF